MISVIVPVYKVEPYLRRCVDSILNQSYTDFELLLIDDGSPDNCGSICDDYARQDPRVHVIHQENCGIASTRNVGLNWILEHSDSQWFTFVDSDDWVHSQMLEYLLNMVQTHQVNISICGYVETSGETPEVSLEQNRTVFWEPEDYFIEYNVFGVVPWGKLYRKKLFTDIRYPAGKIHEDEYTTYKLLFQEEKVAMTTLPLYFYFRNYEGITRSPWSPKRLDAIQALEEQAAYFKKNGFKRAYVWVTLLYVEVILLQRQFVEAAELPAAEKKGYLKFLEHSLKKAGWLYADAYLRHNLYVYRDIFHVAYGFLHRLRGRKNKPLW